MHQFIIVRTCTFMYYSDSCSKHFFYIWLLKDEVQKALCRVRNLVKHRTRLEYTTISATASHFRNALKSENCEAIKNLLSSVDSISFNDSFTDSIDPCHVIR